MNANQRLLTCLAAALASSACSTKPRTFSAMVQPLAPQLAEGPSEAQRFTTCDELIRKGYKTDFASAAATGAAGGAGAVGGGVAAFAASSTLAGAGQAVAVAMPVIGIAAAFGMNRMIRSGRERKYKRTMSACMTEFGYEVTDWTRAAKRQPGTATRQPVAADAAVQPSPPETVAGLESPIG